MRLVYQIDPGCKRLLLVGKERTGSTLRQFFKEFGEERTRKLRFICSDMWKPYLRIVAEIAGQAKHIFDRFLVLVHFNNAKVISRKAYGFRSFDVMEITLFYTLGGLPEPDSIRRFC